MKPMAFVLFESSGVMSRALRKEGIQAYSCDLLPTTGDPGYHFQMDVYDLLNENRDVDVIIAHPTCTAMCVSGNHVYAKGKPRHVERIQAVNYTQRLWHRCTQEAGIVILENPTGVLTTMSDLPKPQYVQPYEVGDDASKRTAFFLHGITPLPIDPAKRYPGRTVTHQGKQVERWSNQTDSGQNRLGPSEERWQLRSRTYPGIARAWAAHIANTLQQREPLC